MTNFPNIIYAFLCFSIIGKVSGIDLRIVGGYKASEKYGRLHASLQNLEGDHVCGGAVVSKWYVVTAAHCVDSTKPDYIKIVAGTNNLDNGGKQYNVESIIIYDNYNTTSRQHDIALLKTTKPFDLRYIKILDLRKQELKEGDEMVLLGFGAKTPHGDSTREMYALNLPVFNQETCEYAMRYSRPVTREMFCTFTQLGQGSCHGDSGGPLIIGDELVGVVSWGIPCAVGFPDVHTRISPYAEWIQNYVRQSFCYAQAKSAPRI